MTRKILVVEDEPSIRNNLARLLKAEKYEVMTAENGMVGLPLAREFRPQLIISDVMMPEMDGYGLLAGIRADPLTAAIPFIFLSAKADKTDFRQGMNLGADDYVTKPFTRAEILEAVEARFKKAETVAEHYEEQLRETADKANFYLFHDPVTSLPNRLSLRDHFHGAIEANPGEQIAMLSLSLDRYLQLVAGQDYSLHDLLLRAVTDRMREVPLEGATLLRLKDDEFAVLMPRLNAREFALALAERLCSAIARAPFAVMFDDVYLTASIGIAVYPEDGSELDELLKSANRARISVNDRGGNGHELYVAERHVQQVDRLALEGSLRQALSNREFLLYYQPQVDLASGRVIGAEALIRWNNPERGLVSPALFIPLAEESGAIVAIGEWVLREACRVALTWTAAGHEPLRIGVNLSARQFAQANLAEMVAQVLHETGLPASQLDLEVTESVAMGDIDAAVAILDRMRTLGVTLSLDDFGTGYSSLAYLRRMPFNTLKVDQCFVRGVHRTPANAAIVRAVVQMAHQLGFHVIAEGVEESAELEFLRESGCHEIQGYYFSKPLPEQDFLNLLASGRQL